MSKEQELTAIFQLHGISQEAQKELRALFNKSNKASYSKGWQECNDDMQYEY